MDEVIGSQLCHLNQVSVCGRDNLFRLSASISTFEQLANAFMNTKGGDIMTLKEMQDLQSALNKVSVINNPPGNLRQMLAIIEFVNSHVEAAKNSDQNDEEKENAE